MHPKLTKIHLLQPMSTYLKKSPAALHSLYLHLTNILKQKRHNNIWFSAITKLTSRLRVRSYPLS